MSDPTVEDVANQIVHRAQLAGPLAPMSDVRVVWGASATFVSPPLSEWGATPPSVVEVSPQVFQAMREVVAQLETLP